jgi:alkanesulfonate monooxygenase SsuD/methylene tetrahydromethanopterin reductase-like flavin-dependent oxidoreductase (luciferase family)
VELGLTLPSFVPGVDRTAVLEWCRRIEDGPFASISVGERISYSAHDQMTSLAFAAACTETVRLVSTVVVLPTHDPVRLAKQAATIDVLSGGRLTLGVGVGGREQDYAAVGAPFARRFARLDEQVDVIKRVWRGEPVIEGVPPIGPAPVQPGGPPILTAAMGPKSLARSAVWADGLAGFDLAPDAVGIDRAFRAVEDAWKDAGRGDRPWLSTSTWFALGDGSADRLLKYATDYLSTFGSEMATAMAELCRLSDGGVIRETIAAIAETGCDEFVLVPTTYDVAEIDRLLAVLR